MRTDVLYRDLDGDSGVESYEIGHDYIVVVFKGSNFGAPRHYKYTYASAGASRIEEMKQFARMGNGLNAYINRHTRKLYQAKW